MAGKRKAAKRNTAAKRNSRRKKAAKKRAARKAAKKRPAKKAARRRRTQPLPPRELAAEWVRVDRLVPWDLNPRKGQAAAVARLVEAIPAVGFGAPLVARRADLRVVAGHARLQAAQQLKLEHVPVRLMDLSDEQAAAMTLADNRLGELAEWDGERVAAIVRDLPQDLSDLLDWSDEDLAAMADLGDEDDVPAPARKPRNPAPYRIELDDEQLVDWQPVWDAYAARFPEASAGDLVAFLCRERKGGARF